MYFVQPCWAGWSTWKGSFCLSCGCLTPIHHDDGECRRVTQAEGGEQGDPLMQGALEEVAASLFPGEQLCAFLDDVYLVCQPDRVFFLYNLLADALSCTKERPECGTPTGPRRFQLATLMARVAPW